MRLAICLLAAALMAKPSALSAESRATFTIWGLGSSSCATAEQPGETIDSKSWIMGFFSAANALNDQDQHVGHGTDANGIWAEVERQCSAIPSDEFFYAVARVYYTLEREGR